MAAASRSDAIRRTYVVEMMLKAAKGEGGLRLAVRFAKLMLLLPSRWHAKADMEP